MRTFLKKLFLNNRLRKFLSILLAITIWLVMNHSMVITKTVSNVRVRIKNIPKGETVVDMQPNGILNRRVNLTITGSKSFLKDLSADDVEVVLDALGKEKEWISTISKSNIQTDNPDIKITQGIKKVAPQNLLIKLSKLLKEDIPIIVTEPIGTPPEGYEFLTVWPHQLYMSVQGPEEIVRQLKNNGVKLTFNLSSVSKSTLDDLFKSKTKMKEDLVSYFVPNYWKMIAMPTLSSQLVEINDPNARLLRIDFLRNERFKIRDPLPIALFFPFRVINELNPERIHLMPNQVVEKQQDLPIMKSPLYVKGVSRFFFETVQDMLQIVILVDPRRENSHLSWSIQLVNANELENRYVRSFMSDVSNQKIYKLQPFLRENYLRNRFRSFISRLEITNLDGSTLEIDPILEGESIIVNEKSDN